MAEPRLFRNMDVPGYGGTLAEYKARGGYAAVAPALGENQPQQLIDRVKASGLRGRGGAGFPTGMKWDFIPKDPKIVKYLVCNADESEPGTFKDRQLIERDPHQIIEGMILASYAIGAHLAFIYIRGELARGAAILDRAVREARQAGYLGAGILGSGFHLDIVVHRGAGAYICGEETALLESLEGKRGQPRYKPPFPAQAGLYGKPTVINNVETLCNIPLIVNHGSDWFRSVGTEKSTGTRIFSLSGHVKRPGNYEVPMGFPLRELIYDLGGGIRDDKRLKAVIPGGASAPYFTEEHLDVRLDFESVAAAGSMLGSGGVTVMDEETCMVWAALRISEFFRHETCGKCTPCREGSPWVAKILERIEHGRGRMEDLDELERLTANIAGKTLCAFGDALVAPIQSTLKYWRHEYEHHIREGRCMVNRERELSGLAPSGT